MASKWKQETREWKNANSAQRCLWLAGIPPRYWSSNIDLARPQSFLVEREYSKDVRVSTQEQLNIIDKIKRNPTILSRGKLIGVGSYPTEDMSLNFCFGLCKLAVENSLRVGVLNFGFPPKRDNYNYKKTKIISDSDFSKLVDSDLLVYHGLSTDITTQRIQDARDWLKYFDGKCILFSVAGMNPVEFADTKLRVELDLAFEFRGARNRRTVVV